MRAVIIFTPYSLIYPATYSSVTVYDGPVVRHHNRVKTYSVVIGCKPPIALCRHSGCSMMKLLIVTQTIGRRIMGSLSNAELSSLSGYLDIMIVASHSKRFNLVPKLKMPILIKYENRHSNGSTESL